MSAGDVTEHSTTAPSVCKGAVSLISRKPLSSLPSVLEGLIKPKKHYLIRNSEFICNLVCITNELKGATSKHLKSLQSQKNGDPKKPETRKYYGRNMRKRSRKNSL